MSTVTHPSPDNDEQEQVEPEGTGLPDKQTPPALPVPAPAYPPPVYGPTPYGPYGPYQPPVPAPVWTIVSFVLTVFGFLFLPVLLPAAAIGCAVAGQRQGEGTPATVALWTSVAVLSLQMLFVAGLALLFAAGSV